MINYILSYRIVQDLNTCRILWYLKKFLVRIHRILLRSCVEFLCNFWSDNISVQSSFFWRALTCPSLSQISLQFSSYRIPPLSWSMAISNPPLLWTRGLGDTLHLFTIGYLSHTSATSNNWVSLPYLRTVPPFVTAHTFCASQDIQVS